MRTVVLTQISELVDTAVLSDLSAAGYLLKPLKSSELLLVLQELMLESAPAVTLEKLSLVTGIRSAAIKTE